MKEGSFLPFSCSFLIPRFVLFWQKRFQEFSKPTKMDKKRKREVLIQERREDSGERGDEEDAEGTGEYKKLREDGKGEGNGSIDKEADKDDSEDGMLEIADEIEEELEGEVDVGMEEEEEEGEIAKSSSNHAQQPEAHETTQHAQPQPPSSPVSPPPPRPMRIFQFHSVKKPVNFGNRPDFSDGNLFPFLFLHLYFC